MAIEKIEGGKKTEWTSQSRIFTMVAGGLALISLVFLYLAVSKYLLKSNYLAAMAAADGGRRADVKPAVDSALAWGSSHVEARELLARTLVESRQYGAALAEYEKLIAGPEKRASALAGKGIVLLRQADEEKDAKKQADLLKDAREVLVEAKTADDSCLEAHIGLATGELIAAVRAGDKTKISKCRDAFQAILKRGPGGSLSREGWIDLLSGLGRSMAGETYNAEAGRHFSACRAQLPSSLALEVNQLYMEAQQIAGSAWTLESVRAAKLNDRLNILRNRWTSSKDSDAIIDPWVQLVLASAAAYSKAGDKEGFNRAVEFLDNQPKLKGNVWVDYGRAVLHTERATAPGLSKSDRGNLMNKAMTSLRTASTAIPDAEPANAALVASVLNNLAFFEEEIGAAGSGDGQFQKAVDTLLKAWEADKKAGLPDGSYEVRRNLAVIQKRRKKDDAQGHYDAALRLGAARTEPRILQDLEELKKFWEAKE